MTNQFIRIYQPLNLNEVKSKLLVYGEISGTCCNCNAIDIKLEQEQCPKCEAEFTYISFRNVKSHLPKIAKILAEKSHIKIIDHDDYKRLAGRGKAEDLLK